MISCTPNSAETSACSTQYFLPCRWYMLIGYSGLYVIEGIERRRHLDDSKLVAGSTACEEPGILFTAHKERWR